MGREHRHAAEPTCITTYYDFSMGVSNGIRQLSVRPQALAGGSEHLTRICRRDVNVAESRATVQSSPGSELASYKTCTVGASGTLEFLLLPITPPLSPPAAQRLECEHRPYCLSAPPSRRVPHIRQCSRLMDRSAHHHHPRAAVAAS